MFLFGRGSVKPADKRYSRVRNDYALSFDTAAELEACGAPPPPASASVAAAAAACAAAAVAVVLLVSPPLLHMLGRGDSRGDCSKPWVGEC